MITTLQQSIMGETNVYSTGKIGCLKRWKNLNQHTIYGRLGKCNIPYMVCTPCFWLKNDLNYKLYYNQIAFYCVFRNCKNFFIEADLLYVVCFASYIDTWYTRGGMWITFFTWQDFKCVYNYFQWGITKRLLILNP